ncbi:fatty acid-binding protein DegV [Mycolicibacterium chubuense]|uniref:DegV domain-containing protein n=1 Tax=Mycolicibacterium chubuense TaxID=1800 RepID=A0A0J6VC12_MYCCU|nr:DegV family protein [Mycolicibacterium chubuense]KMO67058.1 DegV domain-containing protein [Mycolicibacterium chubuense]ORA54225.1 fatty acid-binding protein DegV [Mycolicibacterium chubuense]SPX96814.1 EDD domain protein, DegV family [Mycolicibacterium chubuense]
MPVVVVSDSSSRLGVDDEKRWNIREVPLHVLVDGDDLRDGVDEIPYDIQDRPKVTTAGASPADLEETYRQAMADSGGDGVVAVHLSAALSSTYSAAVTAAREFGSSVRVVNSRSAAMGVGFIAGEAARCAAAGGDLDAVEAAARAARARSHVFLVVHRLDNLRRSGRIGTASSWLGTALSLKPLLRLDVDGRLVLDQRIRTVSKAHAALVDRVVDVVGEAPADLVVHHVDNHDAADELGAALTQRLPQLTSLTVADMGPVLSVHVGSGAVGVAVQVAAR